MKRLGFVLAVAVVFVTASTPSYALMLSSVDGTWSNVVGGPDLVFSDPAGFKTVSVSGYGNETERQVRWGQDVGYGESGLGFTGVAPQASPVLVTVGSAYQ